MNLYCLEKQHLYIKNKVDIRWSHIECQGKIPGVLKLYFVSPTPCFPMLQVEKMFDIQMA